MNDLEYRRCEVCGDSVMVGMQHACQDDEYDKLIRRTKLNVSAILALIVCIAISFFAFMPAKAQTVNANIYRPSTPSQVLAVDTTARTATAKFFQSGVGMFTCTAACFFHLHPTPIAVAATGAYIPAGVPRFVAIRQGEKISVILSSGTGSIIIEELSR
jgi:hypothetical protein